MALTILILQHKFGGTNIIPLVNPFWCVTATKSNRCNWAFRDYSLCSQQECLKANIPRMPLLSLIVNGWYHEYLNKTLFYTCVAKCNNSVMNVTWHLKVILKNRCWWVWKWAQNGRIKSIIYNCRTPRRFQIIWHPTFMGAVWLWCQGFQGSGIRQ